LWKQYDYIVTENLLHLAEQLSEFIFETMSAIPIPTTISLATLASGDRALVVAVESDDAKLGQKLAARGLVPGAEVIVLRAGDPLMLAIDEARWALNRADASVVCVELLSEPRKPLLQRLFRR
jgi:Fe2+ transport system protein FeoA